MGYSKEVVFAVRESLAEKRAKSEAIRQSRLSTVYNLCPEIKAIDNELKRVSLEIAGAISLGKERCIAQIELVKSKNLELQKKRSELLLELGFSEDYTDLKHECEFCKDTGYVNGFICDCHKKALTYEGYRRSGLSELIKTQDFDSFSLDFYNGDEKALMKENFDDMLSFANNFDTDKRSFLLYGDTGLGKTHISTAVAKIVIDSGHDVIYDTAQNIFSDFEFDRFKNRFEESENLSDKYLECDLLIIDDLGTEMITQFSVACLYNIINTRLNKKLPIIISTNLTSAEIRKAYHDRITSRLFGEFIIKQFVGRDIRRQKIKNN